MRVKIFFFPFLVAGVYYILSGQHLFSACSRILQEKEAKQLPIPKYAVIKIVMSGWNGEWIEKQEVV